MPNYKTGWYSNSFDTINGTRTSISADGRILILNLPSSSAATAETLTNVEDNVNYKVPTGKKTKVIKFVTGITGHSSQLLMYSNIEDGSSNPQTMIDNAGVSNYVDNTLIQTRAAPSGKYINMQSTNASSHAIQVQVVEDNE